MRIGDRVLIIGPDHPWEGEVGEIVEASKRPRLDWIVRLESGNVGQKVAAAERDLSRVPRGAG